MKTNTDKKKLTKKLKLSKDTVRNLSDRELAAVRGDEGGGSRIVWCHSTFLTVLFCD